MKRIACLSLLLSSASAALAAEPAQYLAWLLANGVDPRPAVESRAVEFIVLEDGSGVAPVSWNVPLPIPAAGELPSLPDAVAALDAKEAARPAELQAAKPARQKELENEYFAVVEALAAEAGEAKPTEASARDLSKVRATADKVRSAKDAAAGQGKKADADALLKLRDLQLELVFIDAELKTYDPDWRGKAKKHDIE